MYSEPHLIDFPKLGTSSIGYISVAEQNLKFIPFHIQRIFWTYFTPQEITRGRHAHKQTEQVLVAVAGTIQVTTETAQGHQQTFHLTHPHQGLYIPPHVWHVMEYSHTAVQLVFASTAYEEADYLREKDQFISYWTNRPSKYQPQ